MTLQERQDKLIKQIYSLKNEEVLEMLEKELSFFIETNEKDISNDLDSYQTEELIGLLNEPSEQNVINEDDYKNATDKWRSK